MSKDLKVVDVQRQINNKINRDEKGLVKLYIDIKNKTISNC